MTRRTGWWKGWALGLSGLAGGVALGVGGTLCALELPYVNWKMIAAPVDAQPLTIREDAKGDGRFLSPRSGGRVHRGIDVTASVGSPVRAIRSGTIVQVGLHRGLGRYVELEHPRGFHSLYAHLQDVMVEPAARVKQGEVIGTVGKTGNAGHRGMTPHLHIEVLKDGVPINPATLGLQVIEPPTTVHGRRSTIPAVAEQLDSTQSDATGGE